MTDHPRAGGGTRRPPLTGQHTKGPSPRWRGNLRNNLLNGARLGTIPALAGEPCSARCSASRRRDHPRAGGGTSLTLLRTSMVRGPSPRWRGNPEEHRGDKAPERTIPALAGEPRSSAVRSVRSKDHPRAGGGTCGCARSDRWPAGPSPRWRGNRRWKRPRLVLSGTIPALAGEPFIGPPASDAFRDHPRAGGGTGAALQSSMANRGPSPRWRGNPLHLQSAALLVGTIPALAGEPACCRRKRFVAGDHPRAGGGTGSLLCGRETGVGPSPRWRGNLTRTAGYRTHTGTIPALAGEPARYGRQARSPWDHPRAGGGTVPE